MKNTTPTKNINARDGRGCLERVAEHLYRHQGNGSYYGIIKIAGKKKVEALRVHPGLPPTTDRATANRLLAAWKVKRASVNPQSADLTLDALLEKFKSTRAAKSAKTRETEKYMMTKFREEFGRNGEGKRIYGMEAKVSRVVPSDVAQFLAGIAATGIRNVSYNRYRFFVLQLFRVAVEDGVIATSPLTATQKPKKREKVFRNIPTAEEFAKIVAEIRTPAWKQVKGKRGGQRPMNFHESADFAEFEGRAGLGRGETRSLKWKDIDWEGNRAQAHAPSLFIVRVKTKGYFEVPIYPALRPLLERRKAEAIADGTYAPDATVFKIKSIKTALGHACKRLGLPHFCELNLRAMRIRDLFENGVDVKTIALWQGHQDGGKLIMNTYTEIFRSNNAAYMAEQIAKADGTNIIPFVAAKAA